MAIGRLNGTWAASGNGVFNYVSSDSGFGIYGKWSGVATSYYATTTAHVDGNWHHLATTWDGSNITNYLDGLLQNIVGQTGSFSGTSDTLYIGRRQNPPAYYYGKLDNIKIFNTALTPAQIAWEYNQGAPIAHWRLDEKDGVIAYDASDNSNWGLLGAGDSSPALVSGKLNNSADFDGNDYISIGSTISSVQSISFWMKQDSTSQPALLQLSSSDYLRTAASSLSVFGFGTPTVYIDGIVSNYLADTNWHHISIISSSAITANQTFFGYTSGDNAFYSGLLDDIRFFNYPLTPDQIKNLYNGGASVKFN